MQDKTSNIQVIVPCYNEKEGVEIFLDQLVGVLESIPQSEWEVIVVDDGSTDGTPDIINAYAQKEKRILLYSFSRNFGHQIALTAGLDVADGDVCIFMDSDLQHPPEVIPEMIEHWRSGADIVSAVRQDTADASWLKRFSSGLFYWFINRLSDTRVIPQAADFCLLSRAAADALKRMPERHRFLRGMISWIGFDRSFITFSAPPRQAGQSKYTPAKMLMLACDAVFSFSTAPLRIIGRLGGLIAAAGFVYLLYILGRYFAYGDLVPGWASLIVVVLVLGGLQLLAIGISGAYLGRVFEESKHRPLYFFKQVPTVKHGNVEQD